MKKRLATVVRSLMLRDRFFSLAFYAVVLASAPLIFAQPTSGKLNKKLAFDDAGKSKREFTPPHVVSSRLSAIGTPTTVTGFWDFQINGGACEMIRVNPASGNIHAIMMVSDDSADQNNSRRTAYAMSTDNGATWDNFSNLRIPNRRSGYPSLDLGRGPIAGAVIIANHNDIGGILQSTAFVDIPEGSGSFSEIGGPPLIEPTGADEPVWAAVAGASDGSIIMAPGRLTAATTHITRTTDYSTWAPWLQFPGSDQGSARNVVISNGTGRVAVVQDAAGLSMIESTNDGASWPTTPFVIFPSVYHVGSDSFTVANGADAVYNGNNVLAALEATAIGAATDQAAIYFWSTATGIREAVAHDTSKFIGALTTAQVFHSTLGYPVIGTTGSTGDSIVIVFQAFQSDISPASFNFSDLWYTASSNGGVNWSTPRNLTNTPDVDERYPSISKWNPRGFANIVWQEKLDPGSSVRVERPVTRASQKFLRFQVNFTTTGVEENETIANDFRLDQNYPNPFNPSTNISYTIPIGSDVRLSVYNTLGQEVATLVNSYRSAGSYQANLSGAQLSSGVYYYTLRAGQFSQTKKMVLMK